MKFLVLGCNGMAGHMISLYLKEQGHDVLGFALTKSELVESVTGDAQNAVFMKELIGVDKFDTVINCIGLLNKTCDAQQAMAMACAFIEENLDALGEAVVGTPIYNNVRAREEQEAKDKACACAAEARRRKEACEQQHRKLFTAFPMTHRSPEVK